MVRKLGKRVVLCVSAAILPDLAYYSIRGNRPRVASSCSNVSIGLIGKLFIYLLSWCFADRASQYSLSKLTNLMHKFLFYNKFFIRLYMFRALCAHHQGVKIVLYSISYHHNFRWPSGAQVKRGLLCQPVSLQIFSNEPKIGGSKFLRNVVVNLWTLSFSKLRRILSEYWS